MEIIKKSGDRNTPLWPCFYLSFIEAEVRARSESAQRDRAIGAILKHSCIVTKSGGVCNKHLAEVLFYLLVREATCIKIKSTGENIFLPGYLPFKPHYIHGMQNKFSFQAFNSHLFLPLFYFCLLPLFYFFSSS